MTDIIEADPEIVELLMEGDGRTSPSSVIEAKYTPGEMISGSLDEPDPEEKIKLEVEGNLRKVIDYGNEAIKDLADLASSSEHPRPYEAMSSLLKSVVDANVALLDVRKKHGTLPTKDKRTTEESPVESKEDIMKASFGDLLNMIDRRRRQTEQDIIDVEPDND